MSMGPLTRSDSPPRPQSLTKWLPAGIVLILFSPILLSWIRFALGSDLYSYTILVPAISAYFAYSGKSSAGAGSGPKGAAWLLLAFGAALGIAYLILLNRSGDVIPQDRVSLGVLAFVSALGGAIWLNATLAERSRLLFPLSFLIFMAPMTLGIEQRLETLLQHGSATPAYWLLRLVGTPVFRDDLIFQLPGMTLRIAPECSGIRSTLVLFLTSIVAAKLFLRSPWRRAVLVAFVLPLALIRNGFRVFVIGELCIHVGPHMIDSPIHHQGGPIFFALSLIPFGALAYILLRSDRKRSSAA
ncbi:archaeosortase/exosortase family protein [Horticoccus sp. 23ND18S-11]|uniref:archaeosortase/exosortase family protein n=1 Tax=Horticoccus sp. 23ND18S-11 TaxID=3391832 RepID=UPI0039C9DC6C